VARKTGNVTFDFARWFHKFVGGDQVDYKSPMFKRYLGQAARLRKEGFDLEIVKQTLRAMQHRGISIESPYVVKWQSPDRTRTWYEFSKPPVPPIWDGLGVSLHLSGEMPARII
jgi:hypothetical protein